MEECGCVHDPVQVTILGGAEVRLQGHWAGRSGALIRLLLSCPAPAGALVKIERGEKLFLGEICCCSRQNSAYEAVIKVEEALLWTEELARLVEQLRDELPKPRCSQNARKA